MKMRFLSLAGLAVVVCLATSSIAQQEGGRGGRGGQPGGQGGRGGAPGGQQGRGGPGGGFGFGGGGGQMGGALQLLALLRMDEVRKDKDVNMDDATWEAVQKAQRDAMGDMGGFRDMSEDERAAKLKEMGEKAQELMDEVLEPGQQKRLLGLLVQQQGVRSVTNTLVAKEIELSDEDSKKAQEVSQEVMTKAMEEARESMRPAEGERPDFTKFRELMEEANKKVDAAIEKNLSAEQKKALEALKGEKFEFPEQPAFGGRGPGGGGAPGAGGRGGRPGGRPAAGTDQ